MSVITKDLGVATAYGYAKSKGYTGTEEEFAELMASYADVAQQAEAAAQDAEDAKDEAVTAKTDAQTAKTAAESAQAAAAGSAQTASTKASEASGSAQTAAGSATAAGNSATAAAGSATTAQAAAQTATNKASEASSSASAASTAKTGAETARTGAQTAQTAAETAQANAEAAASSVSASAAQIEQNTEDIAELKNDLSEKMDSPAKVDQTPYVSRTVPFDTDMEFVKKIVGGTVVWKQLIQNGNFASGTDNWQANYGTLTAQNGVLTYVRDSNTGSNQIFQFVNTTVNHVLFGSAIVRVSTSTSRTICMRIGDLENTRDYSVTPSTWTEITAIKKANINNPEFNIYGRMSNEWSEGDTVDIKECMCFDIAQMFGTTIADYVYSLESATAGAGVAWLKTHFPKQFDAGYQSYDAGTLKSIEGLTAHTTVADGVTHTYALDSDVVLRGIPKLDSNNQLYYDGDEYLPDGTVNRRYGIVDLGTLNWLIKQHAMLGNYFYANVPDSMVKQYRVNMIVLSYGVCSKYVVSVRTPELFVDKTFVFDGDGNTITQFGIKDSAYTDATAFKASLSGVYLVYEKATATTETADPYTSTQITAPNGTETYTYESGAFELPVGHYTEYPLGNAPEQLGEILDTPSANGTYTLKATVTDGAVTYSWVADV